MRGALDGPKRRFPARAVMWDQCIDGNPEHELMQRIVTDNPWPRPIGVMGYDDTWPSAGDVYEAETNCVKQGPGRPGRQSHSDTTLYIHESFSIQNVQGGIRVTLESPPRPGPPQHGPDRERRREQLRVLLAQAGDMSLGAALLLLGRN